MSGSTIYEKYKDAIVTITTALSVALTPANDPPVIVPANSSGTGFFIHHHYIVCAAHLVLFQPVINSDGSSVNRDPPATGDLTRVQRILVDVYNVNCSGKSYTYLADLVGVDGAGDVAVLHIDPANSWNTSLPKICDPHPYFRWGSSRDTKPGSEIIIIGNALDIDPRSVIKGVIRNNADVDFSGTAVYEAVTTDAHVNPGNSGAPMINEFGHVIGIVQFFETTGDEDNPNPEIGGGVSQYFIEKVIDTIIRKDVGDHLKLINDVFGNFYRYMKGYLGLSWVVRDRPSELPLNVVPTDFDKKIIGLVVDFVDNGSESGTASPFLGSIAVGDVITNIRNLDSKHDDIELGQIVPYQFTPTIVTWVRNPADKIELTYYKTSENFSTAHKIITVIPDFPPFYDYALNGVAGVTYTNILDKKKVVIKRKPKEIVT